MVRLVLPDCSVPVSDLYPEPPATIIALVTWPPATVTLAVAPFHVPVWELFKILTFWYVPLV